MRPNLFLIKGLDIFQRFITPSDANKRNADKVGAKPKVSIEGNYFNEESILNESEVSNMKAIIKTVINCILVN